MPSSVTSDSEYQNRLKSILAWAIAKYYLAEPTATNYANIIINNGYTSVIPNFDLAG